MDSFSLMTSVCPARWGAHFLVLTSALVLLAFMVSAKSSHSLVSSVSGLSPQINKAPASFPLFEIPLWLWYFSPQIVIAPVSLLTIETWGCQNLCGCTKKTKEHLLWLLSPIAGILLLTCCSRPGLTKFVWILHQDKNGKHRPPICW
jgi:hypothetical protein